MKKTYEQEIETLIPQAEIAADMAVRGRTFPHVGYAEAVAEVWNRVFHNTIDRLAMMRGIRRMTWQA